MMDIYKQSGLPEHMMHVLLPESLLVEPKIVKLVGIRNYDLGIHGYSQSEMLYPAAQQKGFKVCPDYLPFEFALQAASASETFIFAVQPRWVPNYPESIRARSKVFISIHQGKLSYAKDQPYGGGVEFAFIETQD